MALREYIVEEIALDWSDGRLSRREAMRRLGLLGLSGAAASALLVGRGRVATTSAPSEPPPATDTTSPVAGEEIRFPGPDGELIGVLATADGPTGAVLVIHENRGLTEHIRSIPPRLAADGYTALAIDLLSAEGGTASLPSEGDATAALGNAPLDRLIADLRAGLDELERRAPDAKLAVIGFCFGGGMTGSCSPPASRASPRPCRSTVRLRTVPTSADRPTSRSSASTPNWTTG
jgi:carboxymethylenebutenolidase